MRTLFLAACIGLLMGCTQIITTEGDVVGTIITFPAVPQPGDMCILRGKQYCVLDNGQLYGCSGAGFYAVVQEGRCEPTTGGEG